MKKLEGYYARIYPIITTVNGVQVHARESQNGYLGRYLVDDSGRRVFVCRMDVTEDMEAKYWAEFFARSDAKSGVTVPKELLGGNENV